MLFGGWEHELLQFFLVVINRIYLHHNLERLIRAPSFWYQVFVR